MDKFVVFSALFFFVFFFFALQFSEVAFIAAVILELDDGAKMLLLEADDLHCLQTCLIFFSNFCR